jgi:hypothetical protein
MKKRESSMIRRTLAGRVERLETGRGPGRKPFRFKVHFVSPDGTVVSKLPVHEGGRREWWHASGRRPEDVEGSLEGGLK